MAVSGFALLLLNILAWCAIFALIYYLGRLVLKFFKRGEQWYLGWTIIFTAVVILALIAAFTGGMQGWRLF